MKTDKTVLRETAYIALGVLVLSLFMESVFLVVGRWDWTVLTGNLLGAAAAILNFFLMGLTVQKAVSDEADTAAKRMKASQMLRMLLLLLFAVIGAALPYFQILAVLIPLFFPRIGISVRGMILNRNSSDKTAG